MKTRIFQGLRVLTLVVLAVVASWGGSHLGSTTPAPHKFGATTPNFTPVSPAFSVPGPPRPFQLVFLGSSLTYGAGGPYGFPGPRAYVQQALGEKRGDWQFIGSRRDGATSISYQNFSRSVMRDWAHSGLSGFTMEGLTTTGPYDAISTVATVSGLTQVTLAGATNVPTGEVVQIAGVTGCTSANGIWRTANVSTTVFTLDLSTGCNSAYVSGGTVNTSWDMLPAFYASQGWTPDAFLVDSGGGLNSFSINGDSGAQAATQMGVLLGRVFTSYPQSQVFVWNLAYSGANNVKRLAYNAALGTCPATTPPTLTCSPNNGVLAGIGRGNQVQLIDISDLGYGSTITGGEYSDQGNVVIAARMVAAMEAWFPLPRGPLAPRAFHQRPAQTGVRLSASTDYVQFGNNVSPPVSPISGSWLAAVTLQPSSLSTLGTLQVVMQAGNDYASQGWALFADNAHLTLYFDGAGAPVLYRVANVLSTSRVSRIVIHADAMSGDVSIWVNGVLRGLTTVSTLWTGHAGQYAYLGAGGGWNTHLATQPGLYRDAVYGFTSAAVPSFASVALRQAVEADYWDGALLPGATAWFPLLEASGTVSDLVAQGTGTATTGSVSGGTLGAVFTTPWDFDVGLPGTFQAGFFTLPVTLVGGTKTQASGKDLSGATIVGVQLTTPTTAVGSPSCAISANSVVCTSYAAGAIQAVTDASTYTVTLVGALSVAGRGIDGWPIVLAIGCAALWSRAHRRRRLANR